MPKYAARPLSPKMQAVQALALTMANGEISQEEYHREIAVLAAQSPAASAQRENHDDDEGSEPVTTPNPNPRVSLAAVSNGRSKESILADVASGKLKPEDAMAELAKTEASIKGLQARISPKGAVSVYGLARFPMTLYVEQWDRLLAHAEPLKAFLKANESKLARKPR